MNDKATPYDAQRVRALRVAALNWYKALPQDQQDAALEEFRTANPQRKRTHITALYTNATFLWFLMERANAKGVELTP